MIRFPCSSCGVLLSADDGAAARRAKCSKCGQVIVVPATPSPDGNGPPAPELVPEEQLPREMSITEAVRLAYPAELAEIDGCLRAGLPVLIECDRDLAPYLFLALRSTLGSQRCAYADGRSWPQEGVKVWIGTTRAMVEEIRQATRGPAQHDILFLFSVDLLLADAKGELAPEAREVIPLLHANPEMVWAGFKPPSAPLPPAARELFLHRTRVADIGVSRLRYIVPQAVSRKLGRGFDAAGLHRRVAGLNAVRLCKLLRLLDGEDYPPEPGRAYGQLEQLRNQM